MLIAKFFICQILLDCDRVKTVLEDDAISDVPLLILANKVDKYPSAGEDEIRHTFSLHTLTTGKVVSSYFSRMYTAACYRAPAIRRSRVLFLVLFVRVRVSARTSETVLIRNLCNLVAISVMAPL